MLSLLNKVPEQYKKSLDLVNFKIKKSKIDNVLFCGMGASGIVGDIIKEYLYDEIKIPILVNKNTLVFIITHSGKTKETLKCYNKAKLKKAQIIGITANKNLEFNNKILIPDSEYGRVVLYYSLFPILIILNKFGLIKNKDNEIKKALSSVKNFKDKNKAKVIAKKLYKKTPVIYSYFSYRAVGYYWKTQLNELSKVYALQNFFPEVNHNEIEVNNLNNFEVVNLKEKKVNLASIVYYMYSADWVAYYLSQLRKVNPLKTPVIDKIKRK